MRKMDIILGLGGFKANQVSEVGLGGTLVEEEKVRGWNSGPMKFRNSPLPGALFFMKPPQKSIKCSKT